MRWRKSRKHTGETPTAELQPEGYNVRQLLLNSEHDRRTFVLSQHPKLTHNKELQLDSSQDPYTANLEAKINIFYVSAPQQ